MTVRNLASVTIVVALSVVTTGQITGQVRGKPVYFSPLHGTGLTIAGDYGKGLNDDSQKGQYVGFTMIGGVPAFTVSGSIGSYKRDVDVEATITAGGNLAFNVIRDPLSSIALSIQTGVGYIDAGLAKRLAFPTGLAIGYRVPTGGVIVEPWAAARVHIVAETPEIGAGTTRTEFGFGASGGLNLAVPIGVGLRSAVDWVTIDGASPLVFGISLYYKFTIARLGM